jgi:uncharacterized membrane protein
MFTGALINFLYPLIGISKPISEIPLLTTITAIILFLCLIYYLRNKSNSHSFNIDIEEIFSPLSLLLLLFPFLAILGVHLLNVHGNNMILLIQLAIISLIPILVAFDKFPKEVYPVAIWVIALSLLLQNSLPSMYVRLTDNFFEYSVANLVMKNGLWDPTIASPLNAMLGVTILLPIFSEICEMSLTWVFKIIVPLLFSFVPLGLYHVFRKQTTVKIAFLSCFFFVSIFQFFTWAGLTQKQMTSGLFLVLFLLLITNEDMNRVSKSALLIFFALSLAVSHHGTSYIFMACLIAVLGIAPLLRRIHKNQDDKATRTVTPSFIALYISFAIAWYMYMTEGSAFDGMVHIGHHLINSILMWYILPEHSYAYGMLFGELSMSLRILKILSLISVIFIAIGILSLFYKRTFEFKNEYEAFSIAFIGVGASVFVGAMSRVSSPDRIFHLITFCLAPFCIIGGIIFFKGLTRISKYLYLKCNEDKLAVVALSVFLTVYLLFNTGFISEVALKDFPGAPIYISKARIVESGTIQEKEYLYRHYVPMRDVLGGKWLARNRDITAKIYADYWGISILTYSIYGVEIDEKNIEKLERNTNLENAYVYLRKLNTKDEIFISHPFPQVTFFNLSEIASSLGSKNKIYDNGGSEVWR